MVWGRLGHREGGPRLLPSSKVSGHRPILSHLALFYGAYVIAGGLGQGFTVIPGVSITFWPPAGIFAATLLLTARSMWLWWIAVGCFAELTCNALWFHNPAVLASVYFGANALEAVAAAWLVQRYTTAPFRLDSLREVAAFVGLATGIAPLIGASIIATTDALIGKHEFWTALSLVWLGDGTGLLVSTPLALVTVETWRKRKWMSPRRMLEAMFFGVILIAGAALALRGYLPTIYATLPPLLWTSARFQLRGAACALALLTLVTSTFTVTGHGEIASEIALPHEKIIALQAFLAISAVSALVVAALSVQYHHALRAAKTLNAELGSRIAERTATLARQKKLTESVVELVPVCLAVVRSTDLCYQLANPAYRSLFPGREIVGLTMAELWPQARRTFIERCRGVAATGQPHRVSDELSMFGSSLETSIPGRYFSWSIHRTELPDAEPSLLIAGWETTSRVLAEKALHLADRRKDEFLATLAHELRNPLAPVRNAVHVLRLAGVPQAKADWARDLLDRQVQAMTRLIDDLMDLSRINQGKISLRRQPIELEHVVNEAIEATRGLMEKMEHSLVVTLPPHPMTMEADSTRLVQVLSNLLNNASKYTELGGTIELLARVEDNKLVIIVRDNGIGIPPDRLPTIFDMFSQVEGALSRARGGLGIGLNLVKRIVEMHGGWVRAHSEGPGKGSAFAVHLPLQPRPVVYVPAIRSSTSQPSTLGLRVLVVDDNVDAAESLAAVLLASGNIVHTVHDGNSALDAARQIRPQVILCDIGLPGINGYEVCRQVRGEPWAKNITLIAITGWGQEADRQRSWAAGFDEHLVKPVDPQALSELLSVRNVPHAEPEKCG